MSQSKDTFTAGEVRELVYYGQTVIFEAVRAALRSNDEEFEAINVRMLRRNARLSIFPELILEEIIESRAGLGIEELACLEIRDGLEGCIYGEGRVFFFTRSDPMIFKLEVFKAGDKLSSKR